jgi:hypothetical protein
VSPVSFLLIAFVVALVGTLVVVAANRSPSRHDSAMTEFEREMRALAPRPPSGASTGRRAPIDRGDQPPDAPASDDSSDER